MKNVSGNDVLGEDEIRAAFPRPLVPYIAQFLVPNSRGDFGFAPLYRETVVRAMRLMIREMSEAADNLEAGTSSPSGESWLAKRSG